jgi:2-polyprenyl-3-methyl-5-hydroxy-6-metoxy-1,4-benzoquinol methylase
MIENRNSQKLASYTSGRTDIISCVPKTVLKILDIGCSNGTLGATLRSQLPYRYVAGVEFDQSFCDEARSNLDLVVQGDLNQFQWDKHFESESFDCLIFADVLEHLIDPWTVLYKAIDLLEKNGVVVISLPNIRHISAFSEIYIKGTFPKKNRGIFDQTHFRWFTLSDSLELCKQANLIVNNIAPRLRVKDKPGGKLNNFVDQHFGVIASWYPIREFLSYQFIITAIKK